MNKIIRNLAQNFMVAINYNHISLPVLPSLLVCFDLPQDRPNNLSNSTMQSSSSVSMSSPCMIRALRPDMHGPCESPSSSAAAGCMLRYFSTGTRSSINKGKRRHDANRNSTPEGGDDIGQPPHSRQALRAIHQAVSVQELEAAVNLPGIMNCKVALMAILQARAKSRPGT